MSPDPALIDPEGTAPEDGGCTCRAKEPGGAIAADPGCPAHGHLVELGPDGAGCGPMD